MKTKLTKRTIESLPLPSKKRITYSDTESKYLKLDISPSGGRVWRFVRKVNGRVKRITIGSYPATTPDMARREARRIAAEYDRGNDPALVRKKKRNIATWSDLFTYYLENYAKQAKKSWQYDVQLNDRYCAKWQNTPYSELTSNVLNRWHKKTAREHGKHQADRVLAMVKTVFNKAIKYELIDEVRNPALAVDKFYKSAKAYGRERFLSGDEIARLLKTLDEYYDQDMSDFFMTLLFTGARKSNVLAMRWDELDNNAVAPQWIIPAEKFKGGIDTKVQIVEPVISILNRRYANRKNDYVFPAKQSTAKCPHMSEPKRAWDNICKSADLQDVRIHDLRRTLGSWQASLGASLQIIGKSLGHRSMQSTEIYARLDTDPVRASVTAATQKMLEQNHKNEKEA